MPQNDASAISTHLRPQPCDSLTPWPPPKHNHCLTGLYIDWTEKGTREEAELLLRNLLVVSHDAIGQNGLDTSWQHAYNRQRSQIIYAMYSSVLPFHSKIIRVLFRQQMLNKTTCTGIIKLNSCTTGAKFTYRHQMTSITNSPTV